MAARGPDFARFAAIDWSGAKGRRHKGIDVAVARRAGAPLLVRPDHVWSRTEVLEWLLATADEAPTLFGFDFSFAPPIAERGAYLPGEDAPRRRPSLLGLCRPLCRTTRISAPPASLSASTAAISISAPPTGRSADFLHHRVCEQAFNATGGGKASTALRRDRRRAGRQGELCRDAAAAPARRASAGLAVRTRCRSAGSLVVEIYTRAFIRLAGLSGRKVRTAAQLDAALAALGSRPATLGRDPNDHESDVLIAAAGLRAIAGEARYWNPPGLTPKLARTEGWTFGVA